MRTLVTFEPAFLMCTFEYVAWFDVAVLFVVPMYTLLVRCERLFMAHLAQWIIAQLLVRAVWTPVIFTRHIQSNIEVVRTLVTFEPEFFPGTFEYVAWFDVAVLLVVPMYTLRVRCKRLCMAYLTRWVTA